MSPKRTKPAMRSNLSEKAEPQRYGTNFSKCLTVSRLPPTTETHLSKSTLEIATIVKIPLSPVVTLYLNVLVIISLVGCVCATCQSPQYVEIGGSAVLKCDFDVNTYNVYWYKNASDSIPLIRFEKGNVPPISGSGFVDASYTIGNKGSLIIFDVTKSEEGTYKVLSYNKNSGISETHLVVVYAHATCEEEFPLINYCKGQNTCLVDFDSFQRLSCSFGCTEPAVELRWYIKHEGYKETIVVNDTEESDGTLTIHISSTEINKYIREPLTQLVCEARGPAIGTRVLQSSIFIDNSDGWQSNGGTTKYYQINSRAILSCGENTEPSTFIWEKITGNKTEVFLFHDGERQHLLIENSQWYATERSTLVVKQVDITSEGIYRCKFYDGENYGTYEITLIVLVSPSPPFLLVDGCPQNTQPCIVNINKNIAYFNLTCNVYEVYPQLTLHIENNFPQGLELRSHTYSTDGRNNRYSVRASVVFQLSESFSCNEDIFTTCRALGVGASAMNYPEKKIRIYCERNSVDTGTDSAGSFCTGSFITVVLVFLASFFCVIVNC
ncbi:uncharacterized protein [Apostichopus japonicus]|uniref:uncharacterized protein isoform X2 n=1 Tax=Stichopus japonicus TaxID=307972 RepID=UPI003AB1AFEE